MKPRLRHVAGRWALVIRGIDLVDHPIDRILYLASLIVQGEERELRSAEHAVRAQYSIQRCQYACALFDSVLTILTKGRLSDVFERYFLEHIEPGENQRRQARIDAFVSARPRGRGASLGRKP